MDWIGGRVMRVFIDSENVVHAESALDDRTLCGDALEEDLNGVPFLEAANIRIDCETCKRIVLHCRQFANKHLA